jgi:hypothetical protein
MASIDSCEVFPPDNVPYKVSDPYILAVPYNSLRAFNAANLELIAVSRAFA